MINSPDLNGNQSNLNSFVGVDSESKTIELNDLASVKNQEGNKEVLQPEDEIIKSLISQDLLQPSGPSNQKTTISVANTHLIKPGSRVEDESNLVKKVVGHSLENSDPLEQITDSILPDFQDLDDDSPHSSAFGTPELPDFDMSALPDFDLPPNRSGPSTSTTSTTTTTTSNTAPAAPAAPIAAAAPTPVTAEMIAQAKDLIAQGGGRQQKEVLADVMDIFINAGHVPTIDFKLEKTKGDPNVEAQPKGDKICYSVEATFTIKIPGTAEPIEYKKFITTTSTNKDAAIFAVAGHGVVLKDFFTKRANPDHVQRFAFGQNFLDLPRLTFGLNYDVVGRPQSLKNLRAGTLKIELNNYIPQFGASAKSTIRSQVGLEETWVPENPIPKRTHIAYQPFAQLTANNTDMKKYIGLLKAEANIKIEESKTLQSEFVTVDTTGAWYQRKQMEIKETDKLRHLINDLQANPRGEATVNRVTLTTSPEMDRYRTLMADLLVVSQDTDRENEIDPLKAQIAAVSTELNQKNQGLLDKLDQLRDLGSEISAMGNHVKDLIRDDKENSKELIALGKQLENEFKTLKWVSGFIKKELTDAQLIQKQISVD